MTIMHSHDGSLL